MIEMTGKGLKHDYLLILAPPKKKEFGVNYNFLGIFKIQQQYAHNNLLGNEKIKLYQDEEAVIYM